MKRSSIAAVLVAAFALAACGETSNSTTKEVAGSTHGDGPAPAAPSLATTLTPDGIRATAKGFGVGNPSSTKEVYVFFDPQCPHCGTLWQNIKPLQDKVHFLWIPTSFLPTPSAQQAAMLLAADKPAALMDEHETKLAADHRGLDVSSYEGNDRAKAMAETVKSNTLLLAKSGAQSVPYLVAKDASGKVTSKTGEMTASEITAWLGLK